MTREHPVHVTFNFGQSREQSGAKIRVEVFEAMAKKHRRFSRPRRHRGFRFHFA